MLKLTDLIETADAARILGLTPNSVRMYAKAGQLRPAVVTPRGARLFLRADVEALRRTRVARAAAQARVG
jgi:DNA-binding transcriptional MerR regulator